MIFQRKKRPFFKHYKKIYVNEFRGYNASKLASDIMAGLTVGAVALPLALAFGSASVDAEHATFGITAGIITAIVAGFITGLFGGGSFQISGPTGAMTVVLGSIVSGEYGLQGMFLACFIAGAILLIAGLLRFGKLIQFIPRPVVTGFTSGIAIVIALGQIGNFFGVTLSGESTVGKVVNFFSNQLTDINYYSLICSVIVVLIIVLFPKKLSKFVPGSLVAIIICTLIVYFAKFDVTKIGSIPSSLVNSDYLKINSLTPEMFKSVLGSSFTIAALGMIESLLCGTCAAKMKKEKFDSNVELIAQGLGNMAMPFFGGVPSTAAIARTSVAVKNGGQTRITGLVQSVFLILCMFVLSGVIGLIPYSALAGVLMVTAFKMNEWSTIKSYFKKKMWDAILMFSVTMIATVFLDLTYAIAIGVVLSLIIMMVNMMGLDVECSEVDPNRNIATNSDGKKRHTTIIYITGAFFFANANEVSKTLEKLNKDYESLIFVMRGVFYMDVSAVDTLSEIVTDQRNLGRSISFTGIRPAVEQTLKRGGFTELVGKENFYSSIDKVLLPETSDTSTVAH